MRQQKFAGFGPVLTEFGGSLSTGKRKVSRPVAVKRPMHVTLRTNGYLLSPHRKVINELIKEEARKSAVRIYEQSVNSNHLHFALLAKSRPLFRRFLRVLPARIAFLVTGARKGKPLPRKFWECIPWTRIVEWGRAFKGLTAYVKQNHLESLGLVPYKPRLSKKAKPPN